MIHKFRQKSRDPSVNPYMRMIDPDLGMPDIFYMMDEVGRTQILRKFQTCRDQIGMFDYCGTYEILYKTERHRRFCLVMHRVRDEWRVAEPHRIESEEEYKKIIVAEYYPGVMSRIYLKGLPEQVVQEITDDFVRRMLKRKKRKRLE